MENRILSKTTRIEFRTPRIHLPSTYRLLYHLQRLGTLIDTSDQHLLKIRQELFEDTQAFYEQFHLRPKAIFDEGYNIGAMVQYAEHLKNRKAKDHSEDEVGIIPINIIDVSRSIITKHAIAVQEYFQSTR